jgi:hypothetical protein
MDEKPIVMRDAHGKWLPGSSPNPQGKLPGKNTYIADIIREKFCEEMDVEIDGKLTRIERRRVMGDALAQLISTGEVRLPNRYAEDGSVIPGKVYKYGASEWLKHLIRVLRYVEPPITQVSVEGDVSGILFDKEIE